MISKSRAGSRSETDSLASIDRPSPVKQRKATRAQGLLRPRPSSSVESDAPIGQPLAQRMQQVGHHRAVETADWLTDQGLLGDAEKRALAKLDPKDAKELITVHRFSDGVWNRSDRNNVRRAVLLCAARKGVAAARQLKADLLKTYTTGKKEGSTARGLSQLDASNPASFDSKTLRDRLDTMVIDDTLSKRLQTSGHDRAQETYAWLADQGQLGPADKARLHNVAAPAMKDLLTVSRGSDHVPQRGDRQNIRRAVMLCAARHGLDAAKNLKERLLESYRVEPAAVRGFQSLDANRVETFEPSAVDQRMCHLAIDQTNFDRLDDVDLPEARSSYLWLDRQNLLGIDDKAQLARLPNQALKPLLTLADHVVGDAGDRRNIRRALLLCASKEGLAAAKRLKAGLLGSGQVRFEQPEVTIDVPGHAQLRTGWTKSDGAAGGPTGLWAKLAEGVSNGQLDPDAPSNGAADIVLEKFVAVAVDHNKLDDRQQARLDHVVAGVDRRLDPELPPERRLRALCQLVEHTSTQKFMGKIDEVLRKSRVYPTKASPDLAVQLLLRGLGKQRFGLHPDLRDALVKIPTEARLGRMDRVGQALGHVGLIDEDSELGSDISRYLRDSSAKVLDAAHRIDEETVFGLSTLQPFQQRLDAVTRNGAPPPAPPPDLDRRVRFGSQVTGKTYDPSDDPAQLRDQPEKDIGARQIAALRGSYMILELAHALSVVPSFETAVSNTVRDTRNVERLTVEQLQQGIRGLK